MDIQAKLLIEVIILLTGICSLAWAFLAGATGISPKACWRYAAANGLLMIGLLLNGLRDTSPSYVAWFCADITLLSGIVLLRVGTLYLFRLPLTLRVDLLIWIGTALAMLAVPPSVQSQTYLGAVFSISASLLFARLAYTAYRGLLPGAGMWLSILQVAPVVVASLSFFARLVVILVVDDPAKQFISIQTADAVPMLWFYLVLTIAINVLAIGNALSRLIQKIRLLADKDMLTGLWNRRSAENTLSQLHQRWLRTGESYGLVLLDLDYFKQVNDNFGHQAGDAALCQVALALQSTLREHDILCRFGGEEFLVVLPGSNAYQTQVVAEKLRHALSAMQLRWEGHDISLSASFGVASVRSGVDVSQLLRAADQAMYKAKAQGRNQVVEACVLQAS